MDRFTLAQIDFTTDSLYISNTGASQPTLKPPLPSSPLHILHHIPSQPMSHLSPIYWPMT
jgi:hypothetical protein